MGCSTVAVKSWIRGPYRWLVLRYLGLDRVGRRVSVYPSVRVDHPDGIVLADDVHVLWRSRLACGERGRIEIGCHSRIAHDVTLNANGGHVLLGRNVYVGPFSILRGDGGLEIGDDVLISPHGVVMAASHAYKDRKRLIREQAESGAGIQIQADVWIGSGATILDGVTVERGAVVGAGAVVTRNVPSFSVVVGVPARVVGERTAE